MEITDVKVIPVDDEKLKAFVSIVFDHCFVVTDIKVINGPKGLFVSMPSKKRKDGTFKDIAHPLNNQMRQYLEEKVLGVYKQQVSSGAPAPAGRPPRAARLPQRRAPRGSSPRRVGAWPSGKARGFGPRIEGSNPSAPATPRRLEHPVMRRELRIFTGSAHPALGESIARHLGVPIGRAHLARFSDGEVWFQIHDNVRGADVFVVQPTCAPVNENLMELLLMLDAFKRSSASRLTTVLPYYGYGRQDRKDKPRVPISAKLVADLLSTAGTDRVLTVDLHAAQIQGFFDIPVDHLFAAPVIIEHVQKMALRDLVVVSPDAGGVERARAYAKRLDASLAIVDKRRDQPNVAEVHHVIGDVEGQTALIVDDIVDTAGTLTKVAEAIKAAGAREVLASCTHPVLSGHAIERIEKSPLSKLIVTDSMPLGKEKLASGKIVVLTIAELLARAIKNIHEETSVTSLFV